MGRAKLKLCFTLNQKGGNIMKYKRLDAVIALLGVFFAGNTLATVSAYDKIDGSTSLSSLTSSTSLSSSVSDVESSIDDIEDDVSDNSDDITDLTSTVSALSTTVDESVSSSDSDSDSNVRGGWVYQSKKTDSSSSSAVDVIYAEYPIYIGSASSSSGYKDYIGDSCVEGIGGFVSYLYYSNSDKSSYKRYNYLMTCE